MQSFIYGAPERAVLQQLGGITKLEADGNHWDGSRVKEVLGGVGSFLSSFSSDTLVLLKKDKDKANDSL